MFDRRVLYDGYTNKFSFVHSGRKVVLAPFFPHQVYLDQQKIQQSLAREKPNGEDKRGNTSGEKIKSEGKMKEEPQQGRKIKGTLFA